MVAPKVGGVVLVPFPFSDLSNSKRRPAVVLADGGRGDWILCQITSNPYLDNDAVEISQDNFSQGSLQRISYARPSKLFTANQELILSSVGRLRLDAFKKIVDAIIRMLNSKFQSYES